MTRKKTNLEVVMIVDRSGSMQSVTDDIKPGLINFVKDQQKENPSCVISLYQFDDYYETVFEGMKVTDIDESMIRHEPRGFTALLDAIGKTIHKTDERLGKQKKNVLLFIVTDGQENASKEYTLSQVAELVTERENRGWEVVFMGANIDSFATASKLGIININNVVNFTHSGVGVGSAMRGMSVYTTSYANGDENFRDALDDVE